MPRAVASSVSVVIPCHNYEAYVAESVESVLAQRFDGRLELIVIDDASSDGSWAKLQRYSTDPRVWLVRHERNAGHVATYNEGMARATGDHVVILSADDLAYVTDALASQAAVLDTRPNVAFVFSQVEIIDERSHSIGRRSLRLPEIIEGRLLFRRLLLENVVSHSGTMVRRSHAELVGPFDEALTYTHDWEQWLRLTSRYDAGFIARPLYAYRIHARQLHARDYSRSMIEWLAVVERARSLAPDLPERLFRLSLAKGHVARAHVYMARGEYRLGLRDLMGALRVQPRALLYPEAAKAVAHFALGIVLRSRKDALVRAGR